MTIHRIRTAGIAVLASLLTAPMAWSQLSNYSEDFEGLDMSDPGALAGAGWLIFGNVFDGAGNFKFGYGVFPAPNGGPAFSAIDTGQGGVEQGLQQLSIYNDYNCCGPGTTDEGHFNGTDMVESNVFREYIVGADDVGDTWSFSFDAKKGNIAGGTTAVAFIKTLDPNAGFATTNFITQDTTNLPTEWMRYEVSLTIDAGLVGQVFQVGFSSTASNFEDSGVFYDNLLLTNGDIDTDGDGVGDASDNCIAVANAGQQDSDGDGHGNLCDADLNNDCVVNPQDLGLFKLVFFTADPDADFNSNGIVNAQDLGILKLLFFGTPGPSASPALCNP